MKFVSIQKLVSHFAKSLRATLGFYLFYIFIFVFTAVILSFTGLDVETALTASASAIGNIGPGLGSIGPRMDCDRYF